MKVAYKMIWPVSVGIVLGLGTVTAAAQPAAPAKQAAAPAAVSVSKAVSPKPKPTAPAAGTKARTTTVETPYGQAIFDDMMLLNGYADKYQNKPKDVLIAMIKDDHLNQYKTAAAIQVYRQRFSGEALTREKRMVERDLLRRLNRTDSPFVEVEIMHTLTVMDRYRYFKTMVPELILKLDHYNTAVDELAYEALTDITNTSDNRVREARIVFNTLRRVLFLSRKKLAGITKPDQRLQYKLQILRWSIKILGTQELRRLPKEVINLF